MIVQEQVLEHEILARANRRQDGGDQMPEEFEHTFSIGRSPGRTARRNVTACWAAIGGYRAGRGARKSVTRSFIKADCVFQR